MAILVTFKDRAIQVIEQSADNPRD